MEHYIAWSLLILPLVASVAILLDLYRKHNEAVFASVGSASLCFLIALLIAFGKIPEPVAWTWISFPGFNVEIGMVFDSLSKGMLLIVTGVGLLVHIFSIGYMANDPSRGRFFGGLSIFMFSMTGIVVATNLIELFFFWEGVGLSSYILIGFWFQKDSAALAANKAFVCNRLADFGFMTGILTFWWLTGTVSVRPEVLAQIQAGNLLAHSWSFIIAPLPLMALGLFAGCVGKSAMFPLHVWLPDAMEGPTPVSALIHAATMVAAGVYMLCRVYPLLILSPHGMLVIALIGCFTAIFAALIAVQQNDIKRILAYSTLSQLGYMVMAVGCGGPDAAMFHLSTHAFFKALLFLAAGSVIHALHDEQDIWKMGGLGKKIPLTSWTFGIGLLALIGVPLFSGSFSKDYVLSIAYAYHPGSQIPYFYWVGVFTAFLTAFYMTRLFVVTFFGSAHVPEAEHPHESPRVMTVPLVILAVLSVIGGYSIAGYGIKDYFHTWSVDQLQAIGQVSNTGAPEIDWILEMVVPFVFVVFGVGLAYALYRNRRTDPIHLAILAHKFYFDEFYDRSMVGGQQMAANFLAWIDSWILDGFIIRGTAYFSVGLGELLKLFQTGSLQGYAFLFSLGSVVLIYFTLFWH